MNMAMVTLSLLFTLSILTLCKSFDITEILNPYPEFTSFSSYLSQTNLAAEINARQTITVLAVDNAAISSLSGTPPDLMRNILAVHVMLDYFDAVRLQQASANSALVTTLFQATGLARGQQGFLTVTQAAGGGVAIGSAMPGSPPAASFVRSVVSQPYNISVVQVSGLVVPQGIDGSRISSPQVKSPVATPGETPPPPSSVTGSTPPPVSSVVGATPPPQASSAPKKSRIAPVPSSKAPPPSTAAVPAAAATPSSSPASTTAATASGEATDEPSGTTPAEKPKGKSAGTSVGVGVVGALMMVVSTFYLG